MSNNIIDKIQLSGVTYDIGGGGGKAVTAGTNISITTGETADTINCTLPLTVGSSNKSLSLGVGNKLNSSNRTLAIGDGNTIGNLSANSLVGGMRSSINYNCGNSIAFGYEANVGSKYSYSIGTNTKTSNQFESAFGLYNASNTGSTNADNTLFSVGNGTDDKARHNVFEIRKNGDIYITKDEQDVKLQDQLGGGGSSYSAGTGIDITNSVISISLPISAGTGSNSIIEGYTGNTASGEYSHAEGYNTTASTDYVHAEGYSTKASGLFAHAEGGNTSANGTYSHAEGNCTITTNKAEHASGQFNTSNKANTTFGDSGNTLFSVGNGTANNARHNAFEIRQNGDIYISSGGTDIKLQDHLGGGGGITSGEVQSMIDESISGKTDESAFTAHTADTTIHVSSSEKNTWNNKSDFSGSYNDLTDKPTIPTSASQLTNDSGYITSGDAQTQIDNSISGKVDTTTFNTYSGNVETSLSGKQDTLSAGTGIDITDNVISVTGGGGGGMTEDDELLLSTALTDLNDRKIDASEVKSNYQKKGDYATKNYVTTALEPYETKVNVEQVEEVTAYALNDLNERFGGLKIARITESEYTALTAKDENTLYIVVADPS